MLAIGRALVLQPRLLMVDELSLGLAPVIVEELMGVLRRLNAERHHRARRRAARHPRHAGAPTRVLFMEKGQVRFSGVGEDLLGRDDLLRSVFLGAAR